MGLEIGVPIHVARIHLLPDCNIKRPCV